MTDQHLTLAACRALKALGYPQHRGWVAIEGADEDDDDLQIYHEPYLALPSGDWYTCPDSIAALDWLSAIGYAWSYYDVGPARGYWLRPHHASKPGPGPYESPSALILAVAEREAVLRS